MRVRGIDLREVELVEAGAEGIRITFRNGDRKFVGGDDGLEVFEAWRSERRSKERENVR